MQKWLCWRSTVRGWCCDTLIFGEAAVFCVREVRHLGVPHFGAHAPQISGVDPCRSSVPPNYSASWRRTSLNYMITSNETIQGRYQLSLVLLIGPSFSLFIHHGFSSHSSSTDSIILNLPVQKGMRTRNGKYYTQ
jgi:hypothetical protein